MNRVIYKIELMSGMFKQNILLPKGAKILKLGLQNNCPMLWYNCPLGHALTETYCIVGYRTGQIIREVEIEDYQYLDTLLYDEGEYVVHYYINKV